MCGNVASKPRPILISNNILYCTRLISLQGSKTNTTQIFAAGPYNDGKFLLCWVLKVVVQRSLTVQQDLNDPSLVWLSSGFLSGTCKPF